MKATSGFEPLDKGFADLSLATWVRRRNRYLESGTRGEMSDPFVHITHYRLPTTVLHGAGDGIRTRDPNLGKVVLYQLSYTRRYGRFYSWKEPVLY